MADTSIRNDFVEGLQEIYTTLFTDGKNDGLNLYLLSDKTVSSNVYGEQKFKVYKKPVLLVCNANLTPTFGEEQSIEVVKDMAVFKVPLKSFQENNMGVTHEDLVALRNSVIEFHGVFYKVYNVSPVTYIEDVFLIYKFECKEDKQMTSIQIEPEEETDNE